MNRISMKSKVNSDGVLHLALPVGLEEANREVHVTVDPVIPGVPMTQEAWRTWVDSIAGSWQGDFEHRLM